MITVLSNDMIDLVFGGTDTAPTCTTTVRTTSDGVSVRVTTCTCPSGTTMSSSTSGGTATMTCTPK